MRIAMIAMTTRSSISVNARRERGERGTVMRHRLGWDGRIGGEYSNLNACWAFWQCKCPTFYNADAGRSSGQCLPMRGELPRATFSSRVVTKLAFAATGDRRAAVS